MIQKVLANLLCTLSLIQHLLEHFKPRGSNKLWNAAALTTSLVRVAVWACVWLHVGWHASMCYSLFLPLPGYPKKRTPRAQFPKERTTEWYSDLYDKSDGMATVYQSYSSNASPFLSSWYWVVDILIAGDSDIWMGKYFEIWCYFRYSKSGP